jgi:hypothetical protein
MQWVISDSHLEYPVFSSMYGFPCSYSNVGNERNAKLPSPLLEVHIGGPL